MQLNVKPIIRKNKTIGYQFCPRELRHLEGHKIKVLGQWWTIPAVDESNNWVKVTVKNNSLYVSREIKG